MKCPFCNSAFKQSNIDGKVIDICTNCNGIWFDQNELQHYVNFIQKNIPFQNSSGKNNGKLITVNDLHESSLLCPCCGELLKKINYLYNSNIIVDRCSKCGGVWADKGESEKIAARSKAENQNELLGENLIKSLTKDFNRESNKQKRILAYRILSGTIFVSCLIYSAFSPDRTKILALTPSLILPITFIWFGDELGSLTGIRFGRIVGPVITQKTPGSFVRFGGWLMLLLLLWRNIL